MSEKDRKHTVCKRNYINLLYKMCLGKKTFWLSGMSVHSMAQTTWNKMLSEKIIRVRVGTRGSQKMKSRIVIGISVHRCRAACVRVCDLSRVSVSVLAWTPAASRAGHVHTTACPTAIPPSITAKMTRQQ